MNNAYLFEGLEGSPAAYALLVGRIDRGRLDIPTHPGRFTPREVIAHLADWEPILLQRLKTGKESPGATVEVFDEGERAIANRYADLDANEQLRAFESARAETIAYLKSLQNSDFDLTIEHPEQGTLSLEDLSAMLLGHDHYHLDQLSEVAFG